MARSEFSVEMNNSSRTITLRNEVGLPDRANRDMGRVQWFTQKNGWALSGKNEEGQWTEVTAFFDQEEYNCTCRYFRRFEHGLTLTETE